ncbi:MAG: NUDIX domain-containing protein [Bacillaceae bacterium]|nr:NUDIX domain-containing protein [Bacillaceae bacterium]
MSYHIRVKVGTLIIDNHSILLIEFKDTNGLHYNLPGGGVKPNESIIEAVQREAKEEASIEVKVGSLAFVYEYVPCLNANKYGETHTLYLIFECKIKEGFKPGFPNNPDPNQNDVKWIKLSDLNRVILYPDISEHIVNYIENKRNIDIIEEHLLENDI